MTPAQGACSLSSSARPPTALRPDIEGLRAFAVLAVLINHAFPSVLPGGFCGVDVFFVISGYLIGGHLIGEFDRKSFSLATFYGKRARRLFPALVTVLAGVWLGGSLVLTGPEFEALGQHMAASALFSNNFLLASETGYFDALALTKPLLHLWSLGVEEQFYLITPLLIWISVWAERKAVAWVARLAVASLMWMMMFGDIHPVSSFYYLHTRFWELGAGLGLAYWQFRQRQDRPPTEARRESASVRECNAWLIAVMFVALLTLLAMSSQDLGLAFWLQASGVALVFTLAMVGAYLIGRSKHDRADIEHRVSRAVSQRYLILGLVILSASVCLLSPAAWPGAQTLWPVLGTILVIAFPSPTHPGRLLSSKPAVWVGRISYPLYLWHWPLIVGFGLLWPNAAVSQRLLPLIAAFLLAWITKTLIEDPIRFGKICGQTVGRPPLWPVPLGLAITGLTGVVTLTTQGLPQRFPAGLRAIAEWYEPAAYEKWRLGECYYYLNGTTRYAALCSPPKRVEVPLVLLWGDSHAGHLYTGMANLAKEEKFDLAQWTAAGCPPTFRPLKGEGGNCGPRRAEALRSLKQYSPDVVIVSGAWARYRAGNTDAELAEALADTFKTLRELGIKRVVVFGPGPAWATSLPSDLFRHMVRTREGKVPQRFGQASAELVQLDERLRSETQLHNAQYFSILTTLCNADGCLTVGDDTLSRPDLLFWDRDHLTSSGSNLLARKALGLMFEHADARTQINVTRQTHYGGT